MNASPVVPLTELDHERALAEVAFLLETFALTVDDLMGGATASVGRIAGRQMARKMPVHLPEPTLDLVLEAVATRLARGFEITSTSDDHGAGLHVGRCAVRDVCQKRERAVGGPVCELFHHYLDGMVNELLHRPARSTPVSMGDVCDIRLDIK